MKTSKYLTPAWTPFVLSDTPKPEITDEYVRQRAQEFAVSQDEMRLALEELKDEKIFINSLYQVNIRRVKNKGQGPDLIHLSIKRRDKRVIHDWRDLQRIKNELVGPEYEGIEIYPAESRLVDASNQYHIWVFDDPTYRLGFGFSGRFVANTSRGGAKQRPR